MTWKVVSFHKSIYSVASHVTESDIVTLRNGLSPILSQLGIDIVLQGHDPVSYTHLDVYKRQHLRRNRSCWGSIYEGDWKYYRRLAEADRKPKGLLQRILGR